ncbi:unnamed protein product [Owenia fusiformis]|uniref:Transcription initiation factor IIF subunit alpha n=1 Tax=Owenia fusiformis TaxID=6347 RepID=A0A8J1UDE2_OWEFU|nr:unnamed protein product [Owenia fusiformis]
MASQQAAATAGSSSNPPAQEFIVRLGRETKSDKFSVLKFAENLKVDFTKTSNVKLERQNNFREFKQANDMEAMPKFGAGSEYGREQKDEARRRKYGIIRKKYNPDAQPWLLKNGSGKTAKKYKGSREGGISDNASYYIFTQCPDGAFEAHPVDEWYNFTPIIKYKYLDADEAEEAFNKRDKTLNYFNIMLKKRLKDDDGADEADEEEKKMKGKGKKSDFCLTDLDDGVPLSGDDLDMDDSDDEGAPKSKDKKKKIKARKNAKHTADDEAVEESDEGDFDEREVDYMTSGSSSDEDDLKEEDKKKYDETGVVDEDGLRKLNESDESEEEEEEKDKDNDEDNEKDESEKGEKKSDKKASDTESSGSSSDSESEPESGFAKALFMQNRKKKSGGSKESSRSNTPVPSADNEDKKGKKRKAGRDSPVTKKARPSTPTPTSTVATSAITTAATTVPSKISTTPTPSDGISEEAVRRYLMRKPMTVVDLVKKFKSKNPGLNNDDMGKAIVQILKKVNPEKSKHQGKLYLSLKAT